MTIVDENTVSFETVTPSADNVLIQDTELKDPVVTTNATAGEEEPTVTSDPSEEEKETPPVDEEKEPIKENLLPEFLEHAAVANFIVDAIEGNGAQEKENEGCTLRLMPVETPETKAFFKSFPPVLHIGVVNPEVAAKFKVGGRVSLIILNED